ncbi:MAG: exonuclease domain-containing protein [Acidimicrobiia bacterium]
MQAQAELQLPSALDDVRFAVVDVETSGLSSRSHRILQVAVVLARADGTVLDRWSSYVRPRWRWFARMGPTHIHGIRRRDVRRAPTADTVLVELGRRLDGAVLAAHNLRFDWGFLASAADRARSPLPAGPKLCTLQLARSLAVIDIVEPGDGSAPPPHVSNRLGDLCDRYGVSLTRAHDALADAEATAALLPHLLRAAGITTTEQLAQLVET